MAEDPRLQPGAYLTNGRSLYEVLRSDRDTVLLQNVVTDCDMALDPAVVLQGFQLVVATVEVPDYPPQPSLPASP